MIAYITGKITHKDPTHLVVEAHGVGYFIKISLNTFSKIKEQESGKIYTYQHITEQAHTLFGFADELEKSIFLQLISVSGVGPSTALMVLSSLSADELEKAILGEDVRTIQSVKGIGTKTAQRLILELKDKIKKGGQVADFTSLVANGTAKLRSEALSALITLGIPKPAAEKTIDTIIQSKGNQISIEELLKLALKAA